MRPVRLTVRAFGPYADEQTVDFDDPASLDAAFCFSAIDRDVLVHAAWNGFAVPSTSHVSPALPFWYAADLKPPASGVPAAREMLKSAGFAIVGNRLHYPAGVKEALKPGD